jgi:hypothetical protein
LYHGLVPERKVRERLAAFLGNDDKVFDPDPSEAVPVQARLERDHVTDDEVVAHLAKGGGLVDV